MNGDRLVEKFSPFSLAPRFSEVSRAQDRLVNLFNGLVVG